MGYRRKINNFWYTSKEADTHHNKDILRKRATHLRAIGKNCVIVKVGQGWRLFCRTK